MDIIKDKRNIMSKIESCGWLALIKVILSSAVNIATRVAIKNQSVLIH